MTSGSFTIAFPLGVTVGKWTRVFEERHPEVELTVVRALPGELPVLLASGDADLAFVRLPVDTASVHLIPLYDENVVVVMHHEHVLTLEKKLHLAEIADEPRVSPAEGDGWDETVMRRVAAGDGIAAVPQSIAKALRRRDVTALPLEDAEPESVGLAWPREVENPWVDEFIGIVRGRTAHSSRNPEVQAAEAAQAKKAAAKRQSAGSGAAKGAAKGSAKSGAAKKKKPTRNSVPRRSRRR